MQKIVWRLNGWIRHLQIKEAVERLEIVAGIEKGAESPLGFALHRVVLAAEFPSGTKRSGGCCALLWGEGLPNAQPREREFHGGHRGA